MDAHITLWFELFYGSHNTLSHTLFFNGLHNVLWLTFTYLSDCMAHHFSVLIFVWLLLTFSCCTLWLATYLWHNGSHMLFMWMTSHILARIHNGIILYSSIIYRGSHLWLTWFVTPVTHISLYGLSHYICSSNSLRSTLQCYMDRIINSMASLYRIELQWNFFYSMDGSYPCGFIVVNLIYMIVRRNPIYDNNSILETW